MSRSLYHPCRAAGRLLYRRGGRASGAAAEIIPATGIGCYFDDPFHGLLGIKGQEFQDLYHFTVGGPVEDLRIQTLPPYAHLSRTS